MQQQQPLRLCCIGATKLGVCSMLTLAERLNQVNIVIIDPNQNLINRWNNNEIPFFEPQVENLLQQHLGQKVVFSNDNRNSIRHANVIFLAADIKSDQRPAFMDGNLDLTSWRDMAMLVRRHAAGTSKIVIDKSSVPIGEDNLIDLLHPNPNTHHTVFYIPEFFSAGTIMHDLLNPDRILIGFRFENPNLQRIFQIYSWLPVQQIKMYNLQQYRAVEVIKIFTNVFLGANAILGNIGAAICEKEEADIGIVMDEISSDRRLRGLPNPHGAIGGHDLNRDIQFAAFLCTKHGMKEEARIFQSMMAVNRKYMQQFVDEMNQRMASATDKTIAVLGFAFKENTDDISDSVALGICQRLLAKRVYRLKIYDPRINDQDRVRSYFSTAALRAKVVLVHSAAEACRGANAVCIPVRSAAIANEFNQHLTNIVAQMSNLRYFFDFTCGEDYDLNILRMIHGFVVYGFGRRV